ncbi:MAG: ATP-binding protein [Bacillota bacterium]|nr:ATP-binding protein [Bacillota bacterium]
MTRGLQRKLVLILVLLIISSMAVVGIVLVNSVTSFFHTDFLKQLDTFFSSSMTASLQETASGDSPVDSLEKKLSLYSSRLGIDTYRNFYILSADGRFLAGSNSELGQSLEITPNLAAAISGNPHNTISVAANMMDYAMPIVAKDGTKYIIYIKDSKQETRELTWVIVVIIVETVFLAMLIAVILSFFLARTITNPIRSITRGASKIADGDFSYKIEVSSSDEIGTLASTFNDMAKVLEDTLHNIEEERGKLQTIFLYMTDGVAAFDGDGLLLHINNSCLQMLGGEYIENQSTFDQMFTPLSGENYERVQKLASKGTIVKEISANDKTFKCDFARFSMGSDKQGIIVVMHDITEQQKIESSRREFIANVSHELRTPLTNVKSYTETVMENEDLPIESKQKFLGVVINEADRMIRIVKDLLVLSKLDNKKMDLRFDELDIKDIANAAYEAMLIEAHKRSQKLTFSYEENILPVFGDKQRIEQVIINILSNAIKYTPDGGLIDMSIRSEDHFAVLDIKDNGIGIPAEDLPRIFERFYRVDKARSREMGGTGLGLAIAKDIITEHGGTISIDSKFGSGTTVTIKMPFKEQVQYAED